MRVVLAVCALVLAFAFGIKMQKPIKLLMHKAHVLMHPRTQSENLDVLTQLIEANPDDPYAYLLRSQARRNARAFAEADADLQMAQKLAYAKLEKNPEDYRSRYVYGAILEANQEYLSAAEEFKNAYAAMENKEGIEAELLRQRIEQLTHKAAVRSKQLADLQVYGQRIAAAPREPENYFERGHLNIELGKKTEAQGDLLRALRLMQGKKLRTNEDYELQVKIYLDLGEFFLARYTLLTAYRGGSETPNALNNRLKYVQRCEDIERMRPTKSAIDDLPLLVSAREAARKQMAEHLEALTNLIRKNRSSYHLRVQRGFQYRVLQNEKLALKDFNAAIALMNAYETTESDVRFLDYRAQLYRVIGRLDLAKQDLLRLNALKPNMPSAKYELDSLLIEEKSPK